MKNKIYNIILWALVIALLVVGLLIAIKFGKNQVKENELACIVKDVKTQIEEVNTKIEDNENDEKVETKKVDVKYKGYNVVGIIEIPKLNIEYPILDHTDTDTLNTSITKFWGNNVNDIGNFTMAGHNYLDGTMFGGTKNLELGDIIKMTDLTGRTLEYQVFDKYVIDPNDVECVKSVKENTREITTITCKNVRSNRLIIKAREVI